MNTNTTKQALVTYETVAAACEAINADGQRPSVRAIIAFLGGGSPNAVLEFQRQWKAGRPVVKAEDIQVDPRIGQIVAEQISQAVAKARADIEAQLAEAEQDAETVGKAGREAEDRAKTLADDLDAAKAQILALMGQIDQLRADTETVKTETAAQVAVAKAEAGREREAREAAQVAVAKAELRLEALPRLEAEIDKLQKALDAERTARTNAERQVAAIEAKAEGLEARLTDTQAQGKEARDGLARAAEQLTFAQNARAEEAAKSGARIGALEGTIAALEKQLAAAMPKPEQKKTGKDS